MSKTLVPSTRSLLETVELFVETTHIVGAVSIDEALRLLKVNLLVKIAIKKGVLDVKLVDRPRL